MKRTRRLEQLWKGRRWMWLGLLILVLFFTAPVAYASWFTPGSTAVMVDGASGNVGAWNSMAVVAGKPAISYHDLDNGTLKYVRALDAEGTAWGAPVTVDAVAGHLVGRFSSLAVVDGKPAISYLDIDSDDEAGSLRYVRANDPEGATWGPAQVVDTGPYWDWQGAYTSLKVVNGKPAIAYEIGSELRYVHATDVAGAAWGGVVAIADGSYASLAVVDGNPAISYHSGSLSYVRANDADGAGWGTPVAIDNNGGGYTSLVVVNGQPAIGYLDFSNDDLKYVRAADASGATWGGAVTVDSAGSTGWDLTMAVIHGRVAIAYKADASGDGDLKYVRATDLDGASWGSPETVFSSGNMGLYTALVEVSGGPAVAFHDATNGDLVYVRREERIRVANGVVSVAADGQCSLIEAILNANDTTEGHPYDDCISGNPLGADTLLLPVNGVFGLTSEFDFPWAGLPRITSEIAVEGNGSAIRRVGEATPAFRILRVESSGNLNLNDVTISGGALSFVSTGGGISNSGTVRVSNCTLSDNRANGGGGISNYSGGTMTVSNCTLSGNSAEQGGGIYNGGTMTVSNSTLSGNSASVYGNGIYNGGTMTVSNSIVANQEGGADCAGSVTSGGHNLESGTSCSFTAAGDRQNTDPMLYELRNNGGSTQTMHPRPGSPAVDAIAYGTNGCGADPTTDQRGTPRPTPIGGACDIGAVEVVTFPYKTLLYAGGVFTDVGGNPNADRIVVWNGSEWNALDGGVNNTIDLNGIAVIGRDVIAGGYFVDAGGDPNADRIARWDGSQWSALGRGVNAVARAVVVGGGHVYAGGQFTDAGGDPNADRVAQWDGSHWAGLGRGVDNMSVWSLAYDHGKIYAGGGFTNAGGDPNADGIAQWDGSHWAGLGSGLGDCWGWARADVIAMNGTDVYVGGFFGNAGGQPNTIGLARWDGSAWSAVGGGLLSDCWEIFAIAVNGSDLYVGGTFVNAKGIPEADHIVKWNGSSWAALGGGLNGDVQAIAVMDGDVYAGGTFGIARWNGVTWSEVGGGLPPNVAALAAQTVCTVDTLIDENDGTCTDGDCSLREAVGEACSVIDFSVTGDIVLHGQNGGTQLINRSLTIDGPGVDQLTIRSTPHSNPVFRITEGNVTLMDLTIADGGNFGGAFTGGGIDNRSTGTVALTNVKLDNNVADYGGGMSNRLGYVVLTNVTFSRNGAWRGAGMMNNESTVTMRGVTFTDNDSSNAGGGIFSANSDIDLVKGVFENNHAGSGGGIQHESGHLSLRDVTFSANSAWQGGAIFSRGDAVFANVTFHGNHAGDGGGLWITSNVRLMHTTISGNSASDDEFGRGGGVVLEGGTLELQNSIIAGNNANFEYPDVRCYHPLASLGYNLVPYH